MTQNDNTARSVIEVKITSSSTFFANWIFFELFDAKLAPISSGWSEQNSYNFHELTAGIYIIKVSNAKGNSSQQAIEVTPPADKTIRFPRSDFDQSDGYLKEIFLRLKGISSHYNPDSTFPKKIEPPYPHSFWANEQGNWTQADSLEFETAPRSFNAEAKISLERQIYGIEYDIIGANFEKVRKFTVVPPGDITVSAPIDTLLPQFRFDQRLTITTHNKIADNLGTLLLNQNTGAAEKFISVTAAVELMRDKQKDHAAAAIGGYYLVKTGNFEQLDYWWSQNLSNWFPHMPDGPIILAWKLLRQKDHAQLEVNTEFRALLLEAVRRGIPIFSEGLKLLFEGLSQLWRNGKSEDRQVGEARKQVLKFIERMDHGSLYTTLNNYVPVNNSNKWKIYHYPEDNNSMAPISELIPQS